MCLQACDKIAAFLESWQLSWLDNRTVVYLDIMHHINQAMHHLQGFFMNIFLFIFLSMKMIQCFNLLCSHSNQSCLPVADMPPKDPSLFSPSGTIYLGRYEDINCTQVQTQTTTWNLLAEMVTVKSKWTQVHCKCHSISIWPNYIGVQVSSELNSPGALWPESQMRSDLVQMNSLLDTWYQLLHTHTKKNMYMLNMEQSLVKLQKKEMLSRGFIPNQDSQSSSCVYFLTPAPDAFIKQWADWMFSQGFSN